MAKKPKNTSVTVESFAGITSNVYTKGPKNPKGKKAKGFEEKKATVNQLPDAGKQRLKSNLKKALDGGNSKAQGKSAPTTYGNFAGHSYAKETVPPGFKKGVTKERAPRTAARPISETRKPRKMK